MRKPTIAIVGPGALGSALARALHEKGYAIREVAGRAGSSNRATAQLAKAVGARRVNAGAPIASELVWICVPDGAIGVVAAQLARAGEWKGRTVLHSSGALTSDLLDPLRRRGAAVASLHPMMSFVRGARPELKGVSFAVEGDARAIRKARQIVRALGGSVFLIRKQDKPLYHAFGAFLSPLLVSLLTTGEQVAAAAGLSRSIARKAMPPIVRRTVENYFASGGTGAFSGPMVRGDVKTSERHLAELRRVPMALEVYRTLARVAVEHLPVKNAAAIRKLLR